MQEGFFAGCASTRREPGAKGIGAGRSGQRGSAADWHGEIMDLKNALMLGMGVGIVLFFVLERTGVIYKWFEWMDNR